MTRFKLDQWGSRWSFARGATKSTHRAKGQSMAELTEALSEVDGLLAGINYLERLEPESEKTHFPSAPNDNAGNSLPLNSAKGSWFGHLPFDLPQLDHSGSEEQSNIDIQNLRKILNDNLANSNDNSRQMPRESQWTTLRSLRMASMYHYKQFTKVTADSTSADIRKLRKSYVTAKNMLDMGILTFRNVLHGQIPTTLVDIFAFASLSYVISKTLHANGHIDESDILSGILDWRAAIADESERSAFDEIAEELWPEAKKIMHFIPINRKYLGPETAGLRPEEGETRSTPFSIPQDPLGTRSSKPNEEYISSQEDSLLSPQAHSYASIFQANTLSIPSLSDMLPSLGGLQGHACQLVQETQSHDDFMFSAWLNLDSALLEGSMDPSLYQITEPNISQEDLNTLQTGHSIDAESPLSESPSPLYNFEKSPPVEQVDLPGDDSALHPLLNTPLFQIVLRFVLQLSEVGDLLTVLSGRGSTSRKDEIKSAHPRPPWVAFEFLEQAPRHFFGSLHRDASQIDETFSGIVAMAEMFVRLGSLHTVREVEDYIITVGRYLARSSDIFAVLVSKTLMQCLTASKHMKWDLLYPKHVQEADEYNMKYINRRERGEKAWADSEFAHLAPSEEKSSPALTANKNPQEHSTNPAKRSLQDKSEPASKRHQRDISSTVSRSPLSESDVSTIEHCPFDKCSKSYTGSAARNNLSRHVRTVHHKKKTLKCPNCSKEIARRDNLRQHFSKVHSTHKLPAWIAYKGRGLRNAPQT